MLGLFVGFMLATTISWVACWVVRPSPVKRVLTADLDLEATRAGGIPDSVEGDPAWGTLLKGSVLTIRMKKADLNYITFFTIVRDKDLMPVSRPIDSAEKP